MEGWVNTKRIKIYYFPTVPPLHYSISLSLFDTSEVTWQTLSAKGMGREAVPQLGVMIAL